MLPRSVYLVALVLLGLQTGCATVTKSANQPVTVDTRPPGAECTLEREGEKLAVINPTPGAVSVEKDKDVIQVTCKKAGFKDGTGELASSFESMTLGNILIGGVIGIGIDAASGAMHQYPSTVTIRLVPASFASLHERDTFFDRARDDLLEEYSQLEEKIVAQCQDDACEEKLNAAREAKQTKLAELETERLSASYGCEDDDCQTTGAVVAHAVDEPGPDATESPEQTLQTSVVGNPPTVTASDADLVFVQDVALNYVGKATFSNGRSVDTRDWNCTIVAQDENLEVLPKGTTLKVRGERHYVNRAGTWYCLSVFSAGGAIDKVECETKCGANDEPPELAREDLHEVLGRTVMRPR